MHIYKRKKLRKNSMQMRWPSSAIVHLANHLRISVTVRCKHKDCGLWRSGDNYQNTETLSNVL